ncbi:alpha/beta fold hydrolase [Pseudomonas sp. SGAir0191]|uniref:alpha/beta hydrolase n=1 Tax=Pseudomonas sp. SGAir0191 TaxID=2217867 RepID=UPI000C2BE3C7|nr:alpha/beta fold hydrolase [Pseudomonas sp. SGAir0191]AUA34694.1 alpha/beta fold hydrolase [Pseudomonas sp. SGAir0191]
MHMQAYSCGRLKWQYEEPAPGMEWFIDEGFGSYEQQARLLVPDMQRAAPVYVLAGARSDFTRLNPLLYRLQAAGIGSLTANLSGHSLASAPGAAAPSLVINLEEAWRFHSHIALECRTLIGHSLGAALALKMAAQLPHVDTLILVCPAIYPDSAYSLPFGPAFSAAIRKPFAFFDCDSYLFLERFPGRVLLLIGEHDGLDSRHLSRPPGTGAGHVWHAGAERYSPIPAELISALTHSTAPERFQCLILENCDHGIPSYLRANPDIADQVTSIVTDFILDAV